MRRVVVLGLVAAALAACATGAAGTSQETSLTVTYWSEGIAAGDRVSWTLRCEPPGGTLPRPGVACGRLADGGARFVTPVPDGTVCTEIYGGPQVARVKGTLAGRRVWATFTRTNGCQISRWDRLSPWLFPRGGVTR